jgi:hypothetical protein
MITNRIIFSIISFAVIAVCLFISPDFILGASHGMIALIALLIAVVPSSVWIIVCREFVKSYLRARLCKPIRVRFQLFNSTNYWNVFDVVYSDAEGRVHQARCIMSWFGSIVSWLDDEIIGKIRA